jgi:hypothetical protein
MNMNLQWPYIQPNGNITYALGAGLSYADLASIRQIIRDEINDALHPQEVQSPSATIEYVQDGKRWKGIVYLVEDEGEQEA